MSVDVTYEDPVKLSDGRYFVKASTGGSPVYVSLKNVNIGDIDADDIELRLCEGDANLVGMWDKKFVESAVENSTKWFHKEISSDVIQSYFVSSLDSDGTLEVQPSINSKGKANVAIFDSNKEPIKTVEPGTSALVLLQFDGMWFLRKTFGPVWRLVQVRVKKTLAPPQCLIDDDSD